VAQLMRFILKCAETDTTPALKHTVKTLLFKASIWSHPYPRNIAENLELAADSDVLQMIVANEKISEIIRQNETISYIDKPEVLCNVVKALMDRNKAVKTLYKSGLEAQGEDKGEKSLYIIEKLKSYQYLKEEYSDTLEYYIASLSRDVDKLVLLSRQKPVLFAKLFCKELEDCQFGGRWVLKARLDFYTNLACFLEDSDEIYKKAIIRACTMHTLGMPLFAPNNPFATSANQVTQNTKNKSMPKSWSRSNDKKKSQPKGSTKNTSLNKIGRVPEMGFKAKYEDLECYEKNKLSPFASRDSDIQIYVDYLRRQDDDKQVKVMADIASFKYYRSIKNESVQNDILSKTEAHLKATFHRLAQGGRFHTFNGPMRTFFKEKLEFTQFKKDFVNLIKKTLGTESEKVLDFIEKEIDVDFNKLLNQQEIKL
jgi:hypothetical protein